MSIIVKNIQPDIRSFKLKNSELSKKCLDENAFWHITSKLNIKSIQKNGLVPHN